MSNKKNNFLERFIKYLPKKNKKQENFRQVYFGLRIRFLGLLILVMIFIISTLTLIMYLDQRNLQEKEKNSKAETLTKILSGPAEFYLDKDINTSREELRIKYETIEREATNFKAYNSDIIKIILTDEKGLIKFSTNAADINQKSGAEFIQKCLAQEEEELNDHEYDHKDTRKNWKNKTARKSTYRAITYPIFLHYGNVVGVLNDFKNYYAKYHEADKKERSRIYRLLWKKYGDTLGEDFDPVKASHEKGLSKDIARAGDIDFLFLKMFGSIMENRNKRIKKGEKWMWEDKWLRSLKNSKAETYINDMPSKAKEINDQIISRISYLYSQVEEIKRLGALAIIFNVDKIKMDLNANISRVINIALIMIIISAISFLFVLNFMIQNLKKLEKWAISVSKGQLDTKIEIEANDEIGRLGDIFNYMLDEVKLKYHLEKFVSSSTRSMIRKKHSESDIPEPGGTGRENYAFIFSDVRGFTSFSEKNDPAAVIEVLNFYLNLQAKIIKSKRGDIDDYTGDQIMAHFGGEKKADTAIETAIGIIKAIAKENAERKKAGLPVFEVGIGVHGGDVIVGNIGSEFRMDCACVGDTVNVSSRLCSAAKAGEILVSQELFLKAKKKYSHEVIPPITVKGKTKEIAVIRIKA